MIMIQKKDDTRIEKIVSRIRSQNRKEEARLREKINGAHAEVDRLLNQFLEIDPELEKAVIFGSLAENRVCSPHFDIDIAVRSKKYLQLVACALDSQFSVDLVDLDTVIEPVRKSIEKYGRTIYEKEKG